MTEACARDAGLPEIMATTEDRSAKPCLATTVVAPADEPRYCGCHPVASKL